MKTLYLVRHAKSDFATDEMKDIDRPLNQRGLEAASLMGRRLQEKEIHPQLLLTSPAVRTFTTAQLIMAELVPPEIVFVEDSHIYNATFKTLVDVIHRLDKSYDTVMLVGHNPGMTQLANYLGDQPISHMPTCGVYGVSFHVNDWYAVTSGVGTCSLFDYPKKGY